MSIDPTLQVKKYTSKDGVVRYMKDGKLHNWDGPAVIHPDGKEEYYLNGFFYTKDAFKQVKKDGVGYELNSEHVLENGEAITGDYEPVLMAIYKGDRSQFGLKGARFVIQPKASRGVTEWIE